MAIHFILSWLSMFHNLSCGQSNPLFSFKITVESGAKVFSLFLLTSAGRALDRLQSQHFLLDVCWSLSRCPHMSFFCFVAYKDLAGHNLFVFCLFISSFCTSSLPLFPSFLLCWPIDRDVVRLQLLLRNKVRGAAHQVVTPKWLGEGNDVTDAVSPDHNGNQSVQT